METESNESHRETRRALNMLTISGRPHVQHAPRDRPRFVESDEYRIGKIVQRRLRILLRSNGCSVPTCTMCPLPNESLDPALSRVTAEEYVSQVRFALAENRDCTMVSIYNDGNFFADREL